MDDKIILEEKCIYSGERLTLFLQTDFDRKIRSLRSTSKDQEERLGILSTQLKDTTAEIENWNKDLTQVPPAATAVNRTDLTKLADQVNSTKKKYEISQKEGIVGTIDENGRISLICLFES